MNFTVFEYTDQTPWYGIRLRQAYSPEDVSGEQISILALNVSEEEAFDFISQTPEICWIMSEIEKNTSSDSSLNITGFLSGIANAAYVIAENRERRTNKHLRMADGDPIIAFYSEEIYGPSLKNKLIAIILESSNHGYMDLKIFGQKLIGLLGD